jgi:MFS transporter, DHA1 family, multidrug/chloramphenicol efflux transport protein
MSAKRPLLYFSLFFILYELTVYLSNDMIMPGMPLVVDQFQGASRHIALSLSLYILGGSTLQIFLGPLAERYGKRRVLLSGNALFLLATAAVPFVETMPQFLTVRFFQGMGSCFIFIGYATIHELFDDVEAVKLTTIFSNTTVFAPLIGPVVGSAIIVFLPWQAVFVTAFCLGLIAWVGLFRNMPAPSRPPEPTSLKAIGHSYRRILGNRKFMFGIFIAGISITPLTAWIGLSPAIVLQQMQASYGTYILYQCVIFTGFILSTVAIQRMGDDMSLTRLIRQGGALALIGMVGAGVVHAHPHLYIGCMFVFSAGFGLFNGALVRLSLMATGESMSLTSSAMSLLYCVYIAVGLELFNLLCERFEYALAAYALANVPLGIVIYLCLLRFTSNHDAQQLALQRAL